MKFTTQVELLKEVTKEHLVAGAIFESHHGYFSVIKEVTPEGNVIYSQSSDLEEAKSHNSLSFGEDGIYFKKFLEFRNVYSTSHHGIKWSVQITPLPVGTTVTLIKGSEFEGADECNPKHGVVGTVIDNTHQRSSSPDNPVHYLVEWKTGEVNAYHLIGDLEVVEEVNVKAPVFTPVEVELEDEVEEPKPETPKARAIRLLEEEDTLEVSGRSTGGGSWVNRIVKARNKAGIDKRLIIKITEGHYQEKNLVLVSKAVQDLEVFTNSRLPITVVKA